MNILRAIRTRLRRHSTVARLLAFLGIGAAGVASVVAVATLWLVAVPVEPAEEITWGVTFSHRQAQELGIDWRLTYTALLDEMKVRHVRIPIYWDELEERPGRYDFSIWDEQLAQLEKRGGKAIVAVGFKLPRWPECRAPAWLDARDVTSAKFQARLLAMLTAVIRHYEDYPSISAWQIENEPLLEFGICPPASEELLDREVGLVRELDPSRPIIVTDTGEASLWYEAGKRADIVGSTLYRIIHHHERDEFLNYWWIPPQQYARKAQLLKLWSGKDVIITELQAEPWVTDVPISIHSQEERERTMNGEKFRETINYARATGIDTFYLWGAEYWYWARSQGEEDIWNAARELFAAPNQGL
ncbi:MAG: beta-galactosidase [Candidatus Spechtbacterales bacterium]